MTISARQMRIPMAILVGLALAILLFATTAVSRAQAADYASAAFSCGGGHNSGSYDSEGNLYIPCSSADTAAKNAGTSDAGAPSHIRVLSPTGAEIKRITIPQNTDDPTSNDVFVYDVAPNAGGSELYFASKTAGAVNPVKKFTVNAAGTSGTLSDFVAKTAWKIATDGSNNVYVANNDSKSVYKYSPDGLLETSFPAVPNNVGDLGGIAVSRDGSKVYTTQMNGGDDSPNFVHRFDSADGGVTYTRNTAESIGGNYHWNNPQGGCSSHNVAIGDPIPPANWVGYFAYSWDVGLDEQGNIYALSTTCHEVLKFAPSGKTFITGMKVNAENSTFADGGKPHGITVAKNGEVYVGEASAKMDLPDVPEGTCRGLAATITGSDDPNAPDDLSGQAGIRDTIDARSGDDTIRGLDGDDSACGGAGNDTFKVDRDSGMTTLDGGNGTAPDTASDTADYSTLSQAGIELELDRSFLGEDVGHLYSGGPQTGATYMEQALYNISDVEGSEYKDWIRGSKLNNSLYGKGGDDIITGSEGKDFIDGGAGNDTLKARDGEADKVSCGAGTTDTVQADAIDTIAADCETVDKPDITPPNTAVMSGPAQGSVTKVTSASFGLSSTEAGSRFECSLDGAAFSPCASPKGYAGLASRSHTFRVRAIDAAGNVDATPAARSWTVDAILPTVSGMSPRKASVTKDVTPTIRAIVRDNLTNLSKANVKLYVNGRLVSPTRYSYNASTDALVYNSPKVAKGKKTVRVVATDAAKNVRSTSWYFTIR